MYDWIFVYDQMFMLIILGFHITLIIIVSHVVILVWGRYNSFCRSLGAIGARVGLKDCLDQPSFVKVWIILIYESCSHLLAEPFATLFQPQYIDGLLNPRHRKISFTTLGYYNFFMNFIRRGKYTLRFP